MKTHSPLKGSTSEQKLKIIIRIRPVLNQQDPSMFVSLQDDDTLEIRRPGNHSYMRFNNILPPQSTQKDVFNLVEDSIKQFLKGTNTTIFAYGQTGAGKTYSIIGNYSLHQSQQNLFNLLSSKERGILSRSLEMIMNCASKDPTSKLSVSFFQIYNEKIYDLYNYTNSSLQIRQSKNGQISIPDLTTIEINSMQEVIQFLMAGLKNRVTGSTQANAKSSRSHSIFQINLEKQQAGQTVVSSLRIVDLAGSEKFKIPSDLTAAEKEIRIQELTSINGSLSCLGHCISALIDKSRTHIPFRNSKLTRILSDSLLGQGKMRFIICISPSTTAATQTFSTLQFANRAKRAIFDRTDTKSPSMQKKKSDSEQVSILKRDLQKERQMRVALQKQVLELKKQNTMLKSQNCKLIQRFSNGDGKNMSEKDQLLANINYYDHNKQNACKEKILKLPIFQVSRLNEISHSPITSSQVNHNPIRQSSQVSHNPSKVAPVNKKPIDFQKKIRKFMESQSPHRSVNNKHLPSEYSFQHDTFKTHLQNEDTEQHARQMFNQRQNNEDHIWDSQRDDSNQFMQRACTRMNLPQFKQLKTQMEKARQQLLNLRKKDSELEQRKLGIR